MKKILLICSAGMSTSMLVKKMNLVVMKNKLEYEIQALGMPEAMPILEQFDVLLLGPQISYAVEDIRSRANGVPVEVIPSNIYALANGEEAIKLAESLLA